MNLEPHTHELEVRRVSNGIRLAYGDQGYTVADKGDHFFGEHHRSKSTLARKVRRQSRRLVERHDRGTANEVVVQEFVESLRPKPVETPPTKLAATEAALKAGRLEVQSSNLRNQVFLPPEVGNDALVWDAYGRRFYRDDEVWNMLEDARRLWKEEVFVDHYGGAIRALKAQAAANLEAVEA